MTTTTREAKIIDLQKNKMQNLEKKKKSEKCRQKLGQERKQAEKEKMLKKELIVTC